MLIILIMSNRPRHLTRQPSLAATSRAFSGERVEVWHSPSFWGIMNGSFARSAEYPICKSVAEVSYSKQDEGPVESREFQSAQRS